MMNLRTLSNLFILNNLAERVGFAQSHLAQVPMNTTLADNSQCSCGLQALSYLPLQFLQFL